MQSNLCLNSSQSQYSKFMMEDREDKTRSTQGFSKLCENCRLIREQLQAQIFVLKDKSHQSFMQVIQVQQLHDEEMEMVKQQHQDQVTALKQQITKLQQEVSRSKDELVSMQKNSKHHDFNMQFPSFLIDNIDMIQCNDNNDKQSKLDDSQCYQFNEFVHSRKEIIDFKNENPQARNGITSEKFLKSRSDEIKLNNAYIIEMEEKINKLNLRILQLESEVESLWETNQELKRECTKLQISEKSSKNNYDSLYKESKFMADHIRSLANDKFKLQRKLKQNERQIRELKIKTLKKSSTLEEKPHLIEEKSHVFQKKPSALEMSLKFNGLDLLGSQFFTTERRSLDTSMEEKKNEYENENQNEKEANNIILSQVLSIQDLHKIKQSEHPMMRSQLLQVDSKLQPRKSMPSYKKVSHISPSPTFKKPNASKDKSAQLLKVATSQFKQDVNRSDFMEDIRKEIEAKASLKKSSVQINHDICRPQSLLHQMTKRRASMNRIG